jgi:uncharacterized protein (DUF111 family)
MSPITTCTLSPSSRRLGSGDAVVIIIVITVASALKVLGATQSEALLLVAEAGLIGVGCVRLAHGGTLAALARPAAAGLRVASQS